MIIDQAEALEWIDQLRVTIPEEIKSARRVTNEVERLLEQAREEAEQILARAQEQATYLIEERELTRQAEELSHEIVRQAQVEAAEIRRGADDYASEVLVGLETEVMRTLKTIQARPGAAGRAAPPSPRQRPATTARETSTNTKKRTTEATSQRLRRSRSTSRGCSAKPAGSIARPWDLGAPPLDLGPDLRQTRGVEGAVRLTRTNRGLLVHGRLRTAIAQTCSRCLRDLDWPVEIEIDEEALPSIDLASGASGRRGAPSPTRCA